MYDDVQFSLENHQYGTKVKVPQNDLWHVYYLKM